MTSPRLVGLRRRHPLGQSPRFAPRFASRGGSSAAGVVAVLALLVASAVQAQTRDELLRALAAPGGVGLMRHARAPGVGDPPGMRLDDCATQRTLSAQGRDQARRIGAALRAAGLRAAEVRSSAWCRARETAELLDLGPVEPLPALDSFFEERGQEGRQTADLRAYLQAGRHQSGRILVTHQVNVTALTGVFPAEGEIVVLRPGPDGYAAVGRLRLDRTDGP